MISSKIVCTVSYVYKHFCPLNSFLLWKFCLKQVFSFLQCVSKRYKVQNNSISYLPQCFTKKVVHMFIDIFFKVRSCNRSHLCFENEIFFPPFQFSWIYRWNATSECAIHVSNNMYISMKQRVLITNVPITKNFVCASKIGLRELYLFTSRMFSFGRFPFGAKKNFLFFLPLQFQLDNFYIFIQSNPVLKKTGFCGCCYCIILNLLPINLIS